MSIRRWTSTALVTLGITGCWFALSTTTALAINVHRYELTIPSISPNVGGLYGLAVDNSANPEDASAGDLYILDNNGNAGLGNNPSGTEDGDSIDKFGSSGNYISATFLGRYEEAEAIAVDPGNGNVYAVDSDRFETETLTVIKFDSTGNRVPGFNVTGITLSFHASRYGIAVDPVSGDVYVLDSGNSAVDKLSSSGAFRSSIAVANPSGVAVDATGNVYVASTAGVQKFSPTGTPGPVIDTGDATAVAVNQATNEVYVSDVAQPGGEGSPFQSQINVYEGSSGSLINQFGEERYGASGEGGGAYVLGVAVNNSTNEVYTLYTYRYRHPIAGGVPGQIFGGEVYSVDAFRSVELAAVTTGPFADLTSSSVTLSGVVNPDALGDTHSQFQYGTSTAYGSTVTALQAPGGPEPGSADDGSGSTDVPVTANLTGLESNTTYHYRADSIGEFGEENMGKDKTLTTPPGPPVLGAPTSEVTPFEATLSDMLNPENPPTGTTSYYFEYGPTSAYGQRFPLEGEAGDGSTAIPATQAITGLTPGTTYHYALIATNSAGATTTPDQTFTTLSAAAPAVSTGAASAVTQYEATLSGAVDPEGLQTSYHFDIGADTSYGTQVFGPTVISPSTVTLPLQNLQPGTTYHYRLTATNAAGTTYGTDETFTTVGVPPVITQPLTPPLLATPNIAFPTEAKTTTTPKVLTNAQKLAAALKACKKKPKNKRAGCQKQARKRYGSAKKKKGKKK